MSFGRAGLVRPILVLVALSLALVVGSQAAFGAQVLNKSGKRGPWTVRDTEVQPGVSCTYGIDGNGLDWALDLMEARSPRVFARNRTSRRDGQWVGIRIRFQRSRADGGTGGWVTEKSTGFVKKFARDDQGVSIGTRAWHASKAGSDPEQPQFRVRADIRWYRPGSKSVVQGALTLAYQWYDTGAVDPEQDRCLPEP